MSDDRSRGWSRFGPWAISAAALVVALFALRGSTAPNPAAPVSTAPPPNTNPDELRALRSDVSGLRDELHRFQSELAAAQQRAAAPPARVAPGSGSDAGPSTPQVRTVPPEQRLVRFDLPSPALKVTEDEQGNISVHNTDPALAGQMLTVQAHAADGSTRAVQLIVPPPGS